MLKAESSCHLCTAPLVPLCGHWLGDGHADHTAGSPCKPTAALQMGAQKLGYFSRAEFRAGLSELGATSVAQLRKALPTLATEVRRPAGQRTLSPALPVPACRSSSFCRGTASRAAAWTATPKHPLSGRARCPAG